VAEGETEENCCGLSAKGVVGFRVVFTGGGVEDFVLEASGSSKNEVALGICLEWGGDEKVVAVGCCEHAADKNERF